MINILGYRKIYYLFSILIILPGLISLFRYGLKPGIDFVGGSVIELKLSQVKEIPSLEKIISQENLPAAQSVLKSDEGNFILRFGSITEEEKQKIEQAIIAQDPSLEEIRFETVGPTLGKDLLMRTIIGGLIAAVSIIIFVAYSFKDFTFGLAAVLAMFHDTLVIIGIFSILGHFRGVEVDSLFVAALMTVLSFSVHDTIVSYDRIREKQRRHGSSNLIETANRALSETLVRSLNNSLTIIIMLLALTFLGGSTIRYFALALLIGTISGTYSSACVAVPLLIDIHALMRRYHAR